jgi:hypothetical protein
MFELLKKSPLLTRVTIGYAAVWLVALLLWKIGNVVPSWLLNAIFAVALPLGIVWIWKLRQAKAGWFTWATALTILYPAWWLLTVIGTEVLGLADLKSGFVQTGWLGLFTIGLGWLVWFLERESRRIEVARIESALQAGPLSSHPVDGDVRVQRRLWNPLDPQACYYGREGRKLKQSTLAFFAYGLAFWLAMVAATRIGCNNLEYDLPAGGGKQQTVAQQVRIQKVIRKKYVVNPFSSIKFDVPPIDEVKLQLQEVSAHQYTIGYGEGAGAGFGGTNKNAKVRLIRLQYDGGDWDLNFGIGGDNNMLLEYGVLTQQPTAEKSESVRISDLARFVKGKAPPLVFITGQKNISVPNNEIKTLRTYLLDEHGMIFASAGSQNFHNQFMSLMSRVLPEVKPVPVPLDDVIHRQPFAQASLPYVVPHGGREALGWTMDGRWLCYYHPGDISDAWADGHAGISADIYNGCYQLGANVINYGHAEHRKWQLAKGLK